jgi:predicted transcriptional regulator
MSTTTAQTQPQTVISTKLSPELVDEVKALAEDQDRTISNIVRRALRMYIAAERSRGA